MKSIRLLLLLFFLTLTSITFAQEQHSRPASVEDLSHSVFGPPRPAMWEFQLSYKNEGVENISSFNFYKKDQRNKTLFFKISDNGLNNRNEFRVQELTGGAILFPINDDDRYQLDLGGTYDKMKDTALYSKAFFSRITLRPQQDLWFRIGAEYFGGYTAGHGSLYRNTILNSFYVAGKATVNFFSLVGILGKGKIDNVLNTRFGFAGIMEGPFNTFLLGGYIESDEQKENVRTLAVGRWAPFRPDGTPAAVFIWKHRDNYDFQLGGIFWGGQNLFVRPAAIGMTQGMFISSAALRENSKLRQAQLMTITDDYRNSDFTMFYIYLDQGIEMIPGSINHVGIKAIQLFKIFSETKFSVFSKPVVGLFYNEETTPEFSGASRKFIDKRTTFWSFQAGFTFQNNFILNVIHTPQKSDWTVAFSFIYTASNNTHME